MASVPPKVLFQSLLGAKSGTRFLHIWHPTYSIENSSLWKTQFLRRPIPTIVNADSSTNHGHTCTVSPSFIATLSRGIHVTSIDNNKHKHGLKKTNPGKISDTEQNLKDTDFSKETDVTDEEIDMAIEEFLKQAMEKDVMAGTINKLSLRKKIVDLLCMGWTLDLVRKIFLYYPAFFTKSDNKLKEVINNFYAFGFTNVQIVNILVSGVVRDFNKSHLMDSVESLMKSGMSDGQIQGVVSKFPQLLTYSPKTINDRVESIKQLFKTGDVVPLVLKSPNILSDDWARIQELFHYVFSTMGIKQRQMVKSRLFRYPVDYVKTRHMFVARAGLYIKPRRDDDRVRMTNPKLSDILDTSDEKFAKMFGNVTVKDYRAFVTMVKKELENEKLKYDSDELLDEESDSDVEIEDGDNLFVEQPKDSILK